MLIEINLSFVRHSYITVPDATLTSLRKNGVSLLPASELHDDVFLALISRRYAMTSLDIVIVNILKVKLLQVFGQINQLRL